MAARPSPPASRGQMKMVARLIDLGSTTLGMKRQIFFVQVGGYDTHTVQTSRARARRRREQCQGHYRQPRQSAGGTQPDHERPLHWPWATSALLRGDAQMQNRVTAFTVSDFARTFPSNGSGSDHGWGSHHFVVGGAVKGGAVYGQLHVLTVGGPTTPARGVGFRPPPWTSTPPRWPLGSESTPVILAPFSRIWGVLRHRTSDLSS